MSRLARFLPRLDRMPVLMLLPALAAALPVVVLAVFSMRDAETNARTHIASLLRARVERLANDGEARISAAMRMAEFVASRAGSTDGNPRPCDRFVGIVTLDPGWSRVALLGSDGTMLCESTSPSARPRQSYSDERWLEQALRSRRAVVGTLEGDPSLGLHVAAAMRDEHERPVAIAVVEIDPIAFSQSLGGTELPAGSSMTITDSADRMVARFPEAQRWVGTDARAKRASFAAAYPGGLGQEPGVDGVDRLFLEIPIAQIGWHAVAGVPMELVLAPGRVALRDSLSTLVAAVLAGVLLASLLARRISRPLEDLANTAEHVAAGETSMRATVPARGELRAVATQFNRMLEQRERVEAGLRNTGRVFESIARANSALGRGGRFDTVARDICHACVDAGFALRIAVLVKHGTGAKVMAMAGPVDVWERFEDKWERGDFGPAELPIPTAFRTGKPSIRNFIPWDILPPSLAADARLLGVHSMAAFPLFLHDRVWGTLVVHSDQPEWFDDQRTNLFVMVANDLAQSLHHAELESARQRAEQELRERDRRMAGIVETAFDAVITIDSDQKVRVFNPAAERMFGVEAADAIGGTIDRFIPTQWRNVHRAHVADFAHSDTSSNRRMGGLAQLMGIRADGTEFPIEASIARHEGESGVLMTAFVRDMSAVIEAESARAAQAAAEAANEAKTMFLANVSHELRTPIHAVLGFTELTLGTHLTPQQYDYLQKATLAADALLAVVDQILDWCDLEAGRLRIGNSSFAVRELVEPLRAGVEQRARARRLDFRVEIDPVLPLHLRGDRQRLLQVLVNLAGNAVKFTSEGEVVVRLAATAWKGADRVRLNVSVRDTGIGMSTAELDRIFQPFVQSDVSSAKRYGGTGLGLAITRQLVNRLGGTLIAESRPGKGSEFSFDLWMDVPGASIAPTAPPTPAEVALRGRRVLVVDDNPMNLELAAMILGDNAQMHVTIAEGGAEGLRHLQRESFDVVLLDIQMPGMDGYETARRIRTLYGEAAQIPIIAFTAFAGDDVRLACLAAGMDDFVAKAGGEKMLLAALRKALKAQ